MKKSKVAELEKVISLEYAKPENNKKEAKDSLTHRIIEITKNIIQISLNNEEDIFNYKNTFTTVEELNRLRKKYFKIILHSLLL